ncbi:MAG: tripartite tricarboxylate transporter substrate binding protein [Burkholderiales bacterium]|nr:tripartite tricarboxylate transporter substrate binding protein [Burkholderiales bacterium]
MRRAVLTLAASLLLAASPAYAAEDLVKIVVGSEAGSAPDILARALAKELAPILKQNVIIENKPGAAGTIGATAVAQAKPDGRTLLMGTVANVALAPSFYPIPYKPTESFTPISMVASVPLVLVAANSVGAANFAELRAKLKAAGSADDFTFASPGQGGPQHVAGLLMEKELGVKLLHVPYKSGAAALNAVVSGEVKIAFAGIPPAIGMLHAKRITPMFVTSKKRSLALPDVPSAVEAGMPAFDVDNWHALFAPAGLPPAVRTTLENAVRKALDAPEVKKQFALLGAEPVASTGKELGDLVASEVSRWGTIAKGSKR